VALLQESLATVSLTRVLKPSDLAPVVVDFTVQPKVVMFPTDAKLINRARAAAAAGQQCYRRCRSVPIGLNRRSSRATLPCRADSPHDR
jgi:hypothetical protein